MKFNFLLKIRNNLEIFKFLFVGLIGALIVIIFTYLFTSVFEIFYVFSTVIAFEISIIWGFFANDRWTFSTVKKTSKQYLRFIKYNSFSLIALGIIQIIMITLTTQFDFHYTLSQSIAIVVAFAFNFSMRSHLLAMMTTPTYDSINARARRKSCDAIVS